MDPQQLNETAWLVERPHLVTAQPMYWGGRGSCDWTFESTEAARFAREKDATKLAEWLRTTTTPDCSVNAGAVARMHAWVSA